MKDEQRRSKQRQTCKDSNLWMEFKAVADIKGFVEALEMGFKNKLPAREDMTLDLAVTNERTQLEVKENNVLAVHYLTMSFQNEEQLGYIEDARSNG